MTVTKKGIKQELERRFGVPLDSRRAYINNGKLFLFPFTSNAIFTLFANLFSSTATEALLSGQL